MKIYPKAATLPGKEGAHLQEVWLYLQKIFYPFHSKDMNSNSPNCLPQIYYNVSSENLVSKSKRMSFLIFLLFQLPVCLWCVKYGSEKLLLDHSLLGVKGLTTYS